MTVAAVRYRDDSVTKAEVHCEKCNSPFDLRWTGTRWECRTGCRPWQWLLDLIGRT